MDASDISWDFTDMDSVVGLLLLISFVVYSNNRDGQ